MSIEIGSKWVKKDGEVVKVKDSRFNECFVGGETCVWFLHSTKTDYIHVLTERDFLMEYKPLNVIYEYQYAFEHTVSLIDGAFIDRRYWTDEESQTFKGTFQRLDFTKRERKQ